MSKQKIKTENPQSYYFNIISAFLAVKKKTQEKTTNCYFIRYDMHINFPYFSFFLQQHFLLFFPFSQIGSMKNKSKTFS
jgi:hypothetical protein